MYTCLSKAARCPQRCTPSDSIKSDRWSQPVQDSEHERPVSLPSFLRIIKPRIVSQNKCQKLWRLNVVGCWAHTGLTFPVESIPPRLHLSTRALRPSPPLVPSVWHSDVMLIIMTLILPLTFTLSPFFFYCKQMLETTRDKQQTDACVNVRGSTGDCSTKGEDSI